MNIKLLNNIINNGGGTYNKELKEVKKNNGFYTSLIGREKTFSLYDIKNTDGVYYELYTTVKRYTEELKHNQYVGFWIDEGLLYVDISIHLKDKQHAIKTGIKNKQLAIYDIKNGKNIDLLKNTYIIYKYNKLNDDIKYVIECNNIIKLCNTLNISESTVYEKSINNIDDVIDYTSYLIKDKYIIVKDRIYINESEV